MASSSTTPSFNNLQSSPSCWRGPIAEDWVRIKLWHSLQQTHIQSHMFTHSNDQSTPHVIMRDMHGPPHHPRQASPRQTAMTAEFSGRETRCLTRAFRARCFARRATAVKCCPPHLGGPLSNVGMQSNAVKQTWLQSGDVRQMPEPRVSSQHRS